MNLLLDIVLTFMKIGLLSFGGGYASVAIVEQQVVEIKGWMDYEQFMDIVTIDELTPGPVTVNAATFVGTRLAGISGAIAATIGAVLPSCIIALILVRIYSKYKDMTIISGALNGLKSMVVALISVTTISIVSNALFIDKKIEIGSLALFVISLVLIRKYKINPLIVMIISGLVGIFIYM